MTQKEYLVNSLNLFVDSGGDFWLYKEEIMQKVYQHVLFAQWALEI